MLQQGEMSTGSRKAHPRARYQGISWIGRGSRGFLWGVFRFRLTKTQTENSVDDTS